MKRKEITKNEMQSNQILKGERKPGETVKNYMKTIRGKVTIASAIMVIGIFSVSVTAIAAPLALARTNTVRFAESGAGMLAESGEMTLEEFLSEQNAEIEESISLKQAEADKQIKDQIEEEKAECMEVKQASAEYLGDVISQDALSYVGILPYVWAGDSLETGVDCSGFTMAIYAKYGITLSHDSNVQSGQGTSVSLEEALPGDIVVYPGHVAMYIGDGKIVHAPHSGAYVSVEDVDYMGVVDVRRML